MDSNPRSPGYGGARFSWRRPTRPMPPRNVDRSRRRVRRAISACPARLSHGQKPASSSRSASATSSIWRRLFAFSATFEICRGDRSCHHGESPNSGRERDSLIRAKISLIARFNSLQGCKKFPVRMRRELARKKLILCLFSLPPRRRHAPNRRNSLYFPC